MKDEGGFTVKKKYILAVDGGSQSTKVTIFDLLGHELCYAGVPLKPMFLAKPGVVEHPGDDLWDSLVQACNEVMAKFAGDPNDIIALGLCSIRYCRCLLKKDGTLAQSVISWMDARVSRPYAHTNQEVAYVVSANGYLTKRLTGKNNDTASNYQGQWPINTDTWNWSTDKAAFAQYNIPREMLFDLKMPGEIVGNMTPLAASALGLPAGMPVVATGNDKAVEALGSGIIDRDKALISLGTYICGMVPGTTNPKNTQSFWTNFACMPNQYLYESGGIRRGMWLISWFKELLGAEASANGKKLGKSEEQYLNSLAEKVTAGSDGLLTVPEWLARPDKPYQRGIMLGFDGRHKAGHIFRSIMEGIAMTMKNTMDAMCAELGITLKGITVSGGGSNSDVFMQIFADVFGVTSVRNEINGAASLGAAICAAKAMHAYDRFETAANQMVRAKKIFEPNAENTALYKRINETVYKDLTKTTDTVLKKTYEVFGNA